MIWHRAPFLRILASFIAGIAVVIYTGWYWDGALWVALGLVALVVVVMVYKPMRVNRKVSLASGFMLSVAIVLLGVWRTTDKTEILRPDHFASQLDSADRVLVRLIATPVEKARSFKLGVRVEAVYGARYIPVMGKALVYLPKGDDVASLRYGDVLTISNRLREVAPPMNPGQFSYKRYLSFHNIYHQGYMREGEWAKVDSGRGSPVMGGVLGIRGYLLRFIDREFSREREKGVASALLLGYSDLLDDETIRQYSSTGAMHVLAVSGLHVAIVFWVLNACLGFMNSMPRLRLWVKMPLLLVVIWLYAALTGLSPSVLRAAVMFTFIVVSQSTKRQTNIYSAVCASAACLLAFDPYLITEIGFLLSYSAVLGIVIIQPALYRTLFFRHALLDWAWKISCVSIGAQLATFPLGLLYFHQFPSYFLASNLVVIPVATVVMIGGLLMFVAIPWAAMGGLLATAMEYTILALNECIAFFDRLPGALISRIHVSRLETWLLYGMVIALLFFFLKRTRAALHVVLFCGIVLLGSILFRRFDHASQQLFVIYHTPDHSTMAMVSGRSALIQADSSLLQNADRMSYSVESHLRELGIKDQARRRNEDWHQRLLFFAGRSILVLDQSLPDRTVRPPLDVDYVVISRSPFLRMQDLAEYFRFRRLIFDSSNPPWLTRKWSIECAEVGIHCHDVNESGAFIAKL
jgi:competence protein ComEC